MKLGYKNVVVTKRSGDGGIDVKAVLVAEGVGNIKTCERGSGSIVNTASLAALTGFRTTAERLWRCLRLDAAGVTRHNPGL
jgi:hypothetical protein